MQANGYEFRGGFPTAETIQHAYDDADLARAIEAYKFFYPTVSFSAGFTSFEGIGVPTNKCGAVLEGSPRQTVYTPNSDTPYAMVPLDLSAGPIVVELPPGSLIGIVNDVNQRWVMDLGLPGPDAGKGGMHVIVPPGYKGPLPSGYYTGMSTTNRVLLALRAIPANGDVAGAIALIKKVKIRPVRPLNGWTNVEWVDITDQDWDSTPARLENSLAYWELLHRIVDSEPPYEAYRGEYGELATLGITKGKPFEPDERMQRILTDAAQRANAQMRVQAFADRRTDRIVWKDRQWEWVSLRPENGTFDAPTYSDLEAREKWFYQAVVESPAMFRREPGAGSLCWLSAHDKTGAYLDGSMRYTLVAPQPVPAKLFWSVTVYDPDTRSEIRTDQGKAALRSLVELKGASGSAVELYFGPDTRKSGEDRWIKTLPGKGWFCYFRIYGPTTAAFDASWKPGDFEPMSVF